MQSVAYTEARLNRWGRWLKGRAVGSGPGNSLTDPPAAQCIPLDASRHRQSHKRMVLRQAKNNLIGSESIGLRARNSAQTKVPIK